MNNIKSLFLIMMICVYSVSAQDYDIVLTSSESGTKTHQARNSITFGPGYSYTPSGGTLTAQIVNAVVTGDVSYNTTVTDPETRSLNTSYQPGATAGDFNVNRTGAATYSIPFNLPSGVAGLQPSLGVSYNSMAGPGIAGYGWNLNGVPVITRSPKTYFHDSSYEGVDLSSSDRFMLNGQRLICTSGSYGANNSQYRTDNDIISKVTCYTGSYGPEKFEVKTKDGLTYQYGYDADSRQIIENHDQTVSWHVNKITDVYGNSVEYSYLKDEGSVYVAEIAYGPDTVSFYYKERADKTTRFLKGSYINQNLLLDKVEIKYNSSVIREYEFEYNKKDVLYNRYSVLNEVIEYGLDSSRFNSTAFTYQSPDSVELDDPEYNRTHQYISYQSDLLAGDFNGDGKADFLCLPTSQASWSGYKMYYGDGNDNFTFAYGNSNFSFSAINDLTVLDLDGDGINDVFVNASNGTWKIYTFASTTGQY